MEESIMESTAKKYVSLYEERIELVASALTQHSKLTAKDASDLAVHVLYAIDHIPEKVR
jgi:phosphopantetheine adenylyltransferase